MPSVTVGNQINKVKVLNTLANYYSNLAKTYMEKAKEYMDACESYKNTIISSIDGFEDLVQDKKDEFESFVDSLKDLDSFVEDLNEIKETVLGDALNEINQVLGEVIGE